MIHQTRDLKEKVFRVVEIFSSIQGEGRYGGNLATFVRFSGCNLSCAFCDEPLHKDPSIANVLDVFDLVRDIVLAVSSWDTRKIIVFTGGEPWLQLHTAQGRALLGMLKVLGYRLNMETNGEHFLKDVDETMLNLFDHITYSPKSVATYRAIEKYYADWRMNECDTMDAKTHDAEVKIVVPTDEFSGNGDVYSKYNQCFDWYWLQPKDNSAQSYNVLTKMLPDNFMVSLQQHKIFKLK